MFVAFILTIFRLKSLEIYMAPENDTPDKIMKKLSRLRCVEVTYAILYAAFKAVDILIWIQVDNELVTNPTFGRFELILQCLGTFGIYGVHIYLYNMGLNLLSLIKSLGLPRSTWAEYGLSIAIFLDLGQASRYFL